ncbi:hypothetical protein quinque_008752 [Culex quinquefasciatus]
MMLLLVLTRRICPLFDKQAIWNEIDVIQSKPDLLRQTVSKKVLASKPTLYRQIELEEICGSRLNQDWENGFRNPPKIARIWNAIREEIVKVSTLAWESRDARWRLSFVLVQCMRTATAPAVCAVMENLVFNLFGAPAVCITDNAKVFMSDQFTKTLEKYKVTQWNLAVYHPSPNPSERVNRVIVTAIRCALNKHVNHRDWDESVQLIAKAIRTSVHDSTGYTPYFVNFGRNMVSSGAEYDHLRELQEHDFEPAQVQEDQKKLYEIVRTNLHKAYQRYSKPYNLRSNAKHRFQEGDLVYKRNVHQSDAAKQFVGKFGEKYSKARVRQSLGTNTYVLEDEKGKRIPGTFHGSFLKKA